MAETIDIELVDDEEESAECPECGAEMDADDTVCPQCGAEFGFYCPECDEEVPLDATVCPHCGTELDEDFEDEDAEGAEDLPADDGASEGATAERGDEDRAEFCADCGEPIDEEDEECPSCGIDLCPDCGSPLDPDEDECAECGAQFAFSCPACSEDLDPDADVCPHCGYSFDEDEDDD